MKGRGKWLILSGVLAFLTSYLLLMLLKQYAMQEVSSQPKVKVVVAAQEIGERTKLSAGMLKLQEISADSVPPQAMTSLEEAVEAVTRQRIVAGQVLMQPMVTKQDVSQGGLFALKVPYGKRAVSITSNEVIAVGGMLLPGDRVDVLAGYRKDLIPGGKQQDVVKMVLQDIEVLAIGTRSRLDEPTSTAATGTDGKAAQKQQEKEAARTTVTLAVTPAQAEALMFADANGTVRLALRGVEDREKVETPGLTNEGLIQPR
jgi:pilus assembly protein CpaB